MLPSLFISHGSPMLMIEENNTTQFLKNLSSSIEKPKYILVISAHWVTNDLKILYKENPGLIYDFYNFPKELYQLKYNAKSDLNKIKQIVQLLESNHIKVDKDSSRSGFDHGVWSPLQFIYPKGDIPVIQLSLPINMNPSELFKIGSILKTLREDTLIIGSGSLTHNLYDLNRTIDEEYVKDYAKKFHDWVLNSLKDDNYKELLDFVNKAPFLRENHPSLEHFLPIFIALGASENRIGESLNNRFMYGNLSMDTIIFKE